MSAGLQDMDPDNAKRWQWEAGSGQNTIGLIDYLNMALLDVSVQRPDCYSITEPIKLVAGFLQSIPVKDVNGATGNALMLCELVRNLGSNGKTLGRSIHKANQQVIFAWYNPYQTMKRSYDYEVDSYMYDRAANPKIYYVYPPVPSNATVWVECTYYALPKEVTSVTDDLPVSIGYAQALAHHIMASIYEADNESANAERATYHRKQFQECMNAKLQADMRAPRADISFNRSA